MATVGLNINTKKKQENKKEQTQFIALNSNGPTKASGGSGSDIKQVHDFTYQSKIHQSQILQSNSRVSTLLRITVPDFKRKLENMLNGTCTGML